MIIQFYLSNWSPSAILWELAHWLISLFIFIYSCVQAPSLISLRWLPALVSKLLVGTEFLMVLKIEHFHILNAIVSMMGLKYWRLKSWITELTVVLVPSNRLPVRVLYYWHFKINGITATVMIHLFHLFLILMPSLLIRIYVPVGTVLANYDPIVGI